MTLTPGPRQTQQRGTHATLGLGLAVFENGPSFFIPDGGEPVEMFIAHGGSSSKPTRRAWLRSSEGEIDITGEKRGDSHKTAWHPRLGPGWLVWMPLEENRCPMRFDADSGEVLAFAWEECRVGKPGKEPKRPKTREQAKSAELLEWEQWTTFKSTDGEVFVFRKSAPEAAAEKPAATVHEQGSLF